MWVYFKANLFTLYFFGGRFFYKRSLWSLLGFFAHQGGGNHEDALVDAPSAAVVAGEGRVEHRRVHSKRVDF